MKALIQKISSIYKGIRRFLEKNSEDHISAYSAQAAFFLLLSVFPMLLIILNMARFLPFTRQDIITVLSSVVPSEFMQYISRAVVDLYAKSKVPFLSVSVVAAIWSSAKGMMAIAQGMDSVYDCFEYKGFFVWKLKSMLYTIVFILLLVITLCVFVFGNGIYKWLTFLLPQIPFWAELVIALRFVLGVAVLFVFFLLLYTFIPTRHNEWKQQWIGALFSSVAWIVLSYAFSVYIDHSSGFSYMYGSLTTIMLAMLWLYLCMYIVFIGGELNFQLSKR